MSRLPVSRLWSRAQLCAPGSVAAPRHPAPDLHASRRAMTVESATMLRWLRDHGPADALGVHRSLTMQSWPVRNQLWTTDRLRMLERHGYLRRLAGTQYEYLRDPDAR